MTRSRALIVGLVVLIAIGIGGYVAYDQVLKGDSTPPLTFPSSSPDAAATAGASAGESTGPVATFDGVVAGTWTVAAGSQAGYRVTEQLASLPAASEAVGRTDQITGSIEITTDGSTTTLASGSLTVDATPLASDESRRDNRMRSEGLQTDQYPTATFTLTQPVEIPAAAIDGTQSDITLVGDMTLHGTTKSVSIPAKAQLVDGQIQVVGSITFPLSDFGITPPNVGGFIISIEDKGTLEFAVAFAKG